MAGLVPAIHVLLCLQDVDARHKAGHDDGVCGDVENLSPLPFITRQRALHRARPALQLLLARCRAHVEKVLLVSDDAIRQAQAALWSTLRVVAEPGGAAAFAALLSGRYRPAHGERVAVLVCGANTTAVKFEG